jgi:uncharacterized protein involved in response to NO
MQSDKPVPDFALFNLGFRPFFMGAMAYSIVAVLIWMALYSLRISLPDTGITAFQWHAHEMIYGYSFAVIAGFLLTAVKSWTGIQTVHGRGLALVFTIWLIARVLFSLGWPGMAGLFDLAFSILLLFFAAVPVVKSRSWRQMVILSKLGLLILANLCFYLGYTGVLESGLHWGIYGGLYLVISLILTIAARVVPLFIENSVEYPVKLKNPRWIMISGLVVFLVFFISEVFLLNTVLTGITSVLLFVIYTIRLVGWHTYGIWKKPLLWGFFMALVFIDIGFLLFAFSSFTGISKYMAIHAFAYGGIGLVTVSMMVRVTLGHTGRNINRHGPIINYILGFLVIGAVVRVFLPLALPDMYVAWVMTSQVLWIVAFLLVLFYCAPMLTGPRVDGNPG